jgi:hypothetical protein
VADRKQEFLAELDAQKAAPVLMRGDGEAVEYGVFTNTVLSYVKKKAREQIDTEEERDSLKEMILTLADKFVGPQIPFWAMFVRPNLAQLIDDAMDRLPELLASE